MLYRINLGSKLNEDKILADYLQKGYTKFLSTKPFDFCFFEGDYRWVRLVNLTSYSEAETRAIASSSTAITELLDSIVTKNVLFLAAYM